MIFLDRIDALKATLDGPFLARLQAKLRLQPVPDEGADD
jgi:hypothetical protein